MTIAETPKLNEEPCPIPEYLFGQISRASPLDAVEIATTLAEPERARLATFCYYRRHLHVVGLMIASGCDRTSLVNAGGRVGEMIFRQSRDPQKTLSQELHPPGSRPRKPISLAGCRA